MVKGVFKRGSRAEGLKMGSVEMCEEFFLIFFSLSQMENKL